MTVTQRQKSELARRKAMPIVKVERPLRFIRAKTNTKRTDGQGNVLIEESPESIAAAEYAKDGDGYSVNIIALQIANEKV